MRNSIVLVTSQHSSKKTVLPKRIGCTNLRNARQSNAMMNRNNDLRPAETGDNWTALADVVTSHTVPW